ncbi:hypothetical protein HMPREF9080_00204 [Cardiobacterium valvarum F0432]|uniref:Uncharacterized protein n=1 Tax=Cardiobacterium valvarum F0432 TaxID=797473 RepID=G9ZBS7_9GAMM|nr:hypothetical protein HMPREF9080_00204 [Cardiobacterium valvarum F0432]
MSLRGFVQPPPQPLPHKKGEGLFLCEIRVRYAPSGIKPDLAKRRVLGSSGKIRSI